MALQRDRFAAVDFGRAGDAVAEIEYDDVTPFPIMAVEIIGTISGGAVAVVQLTNFAIDADRGREINYRVLVNGTQRRVFSGTEQDEWRYQEVRDNGGTQVKQTNDLQFHVAWDTLGR